ncbi:MAG: cupredoxin domain-containing protein [Nitrospirae bacterium]|nr:cupredoxin domain-containing protein [Nitrospirota bacterium]
MRFKFLLFGILTVVLTAGGLSPLPAMSGESALSAVPSAPGKEFTLIAATVAEGANIWLPSTLIVRAGDEVKLTLKNVAKVEHGFAIDELGIKEVIQPGETKQITLKLPSAGVLRYYCHLHPGHISGQILIQTTL